MLTKGILFHQVKAVAHNLMVAIEKYVTVGTSSFKTRLTRRTSPLRLQPLPIPVKDMTGKRYVTDDDVIFRTEHVELKSMGKYNKRCLLQDGYAEHVQTCHIFHRQNFIVLSLRFLCEAQNFSATPRTSAQKGERTLATVSSRWFQSYGNPINVTFRGSEPRTSRLPVECSTDRLVSTT